MDPTEQQHEVERLKRKHENLQDAMLPPVPPEKQIAPVVSDDWTKATRKALNLSDGTVDMFQDRELESRDEYEKTAKLFAHYQLNINRFLGKLQSLLVEAIEHIEVLESNFQRLK